MAWIHSYSLQFIVTWLELQICSIVLLLNFFKFPFFSLFKWFIFLSAHFQFQPKFNCLCSLNLIPFTTNKWSKGVPPFFPLPCCSHPASWPTEQASRHKQLRSPGCYRFIYKLQSSSRQNMCITTVCNQCQDILAELNELQFKYYVTFRSNHCILTRILSLFAVPESAGRGWAASVELPRKQRAG